MATSETNSKLTNGEAQMGGSRIELVEEIANLSKIPEIEEYFLQALLEAKQKYQVQIKEYYRLKDNFESESSKDKPEEIKEEVIPGLLKAFEKSKTYFFEFTRVNDPGTAPGYRWELGKFKLKTKAEGKIVDIIFDDFIKDVDQYEVTPHRIRDEIVDVPSLQKKLQISFTKSSPTRVVGFVKEAKPIEEKQGEKADDLQVVKRNRNMLKLDTGRTKTLEINKKELEELLQNNPEFTENMIFSIRLKQFVDHPQ